MDTQAQLLLDEIDAYLKTQPIAETTFGRLAVNDGKFVGRLRAGCNLTFATAARVRAFISRSPAPMPGPVRQTLGSGIMTHQPPQENDRKVRP